MFHGPVSMANAIHLRMHLICIALCVTYGNITTLKFNWTKIQRMYPPNWADLHLSAYSISWYKYYFMVITYFQVQKMNAMVKWLWFDQTNHNESLGNYLGLTTPSYMLPQFLVLIIWYMSAKWCIVFNITAGYW